MKSFSSPFGSHLNFLDQQLTEDGKHYGPIRYREIVKECYVITKNLHTPYSDVMNMSPTERHYLIDFLIEDAKEQAKELEKRKAEREANAKAQTRKR